MNGRFLIYAIFGIFHDGKLIATTPYSTIIEFDDVEEAVRGAKIQECLRMYINRIKMELAEKIEPSGIGDISCFDISTSITKL